jgi:outer membrane protein OmpA-like peptidoglycan-associated protein
MRTLKFFALVGIFSAFLRPLPTPAANLNYHQLSDEHPNYVVIGAFRFQRNATRFTSHAQKDLRLDAKFELNKNRNLYYVYVLNTADRDQAIAEALRLRSESEFKDTWVYSGNLGKLKAGQEAYAGVDINPATNRAMDEVSVDKGQAAGTSESPVVEANNAESVPAETKPVTEEVKKTAAEPDSEIEGRKFFFSLARATDKEKVEGDVDVIDLDKVKKLGTYKANMDVKVGKPTGKSGKISLVCEVFGYRKVQKDVDYNNPSGEGITADENGAVVVPFELTRLQKGDIAVMYNVYFFKDAAIMRPESRYEITSLLDMLKENPNYKIKIHGHTNGKANGKIISLEEGNTNFFSLSKTREGFGSAKKLSEERAEMIKDFLVTNGIDAARMQIKPWGGKRPIHDKHSTRAQENVRVEIEILED